MFLALIHIFTWGFLSIAGYENTNAPSPLSPQGETPEPFGKSIYSATPGNRPGGNAPGNPPQATQPPAQRAKAGLGIKNPEAVAKRGRSLKANPSFAKSPASARTPNRKISSQPKTLPLKKKTTR